MMRIRKILVILGFMLVGSACEKEKTLPEVEVYFEFEGRPFIEKVFSKEDMVEGMRGLTWDQEKQYEYFGEGVYGLHVNEGIHESVFFYWRGWTLPQEELDKLEPGDLVFVTNISADPIGGLNLEVKKSVDPDPMRIDFKVFDYRIGYNTYIQPEPD